MEIADWRKKIDAIDRELVRLLNERARCVAEIGEIKRAHALPIQEASREQEVLKNVLDSNQGPLENEELRRVFQQIVEEGKGLQRRLFEEKRGGGTDRTRSQESEVRSQKGKPGPSPPRSSR